MSHWNHRIAKISTSYIDILTKEEKLWDTYGIVECYYDDNGDVNGYTNFIELVGDSPTELKDDLYLMLRAFDKPILDLGKQ